MRHLNLLILAFLLGIPCSRAQEPVLRTITYLGMERSYYVVVPEQLDPHRPLVMLLHGYGGKAEGYMPEMVESARRNGFVLCIPQGWPAPGTDDAGWNVGYPMQEGMESDDIAFLDDLAKMMQIQYGLSRNATFLTGMSNGGEMCYAFCRLRPESFRAIASVAGLTMDWMVREHPMPSKEVPFMEVHGTADTTSLWQGDSEGRFGWGPYLSVPEALNHVIAQNGCSYEKTQELPLLSPDAHRVILHRYMGGTRGAEVRLYEVVGGTHSWMLEDMDTVEEIWKFFTMFLK